MTTVTCYLMFRWYYGPEFSGKALDTWAFEHGVQIEFSRPGKPTDNGHIESFTGKLRDKLLDGELFMTLQEAEIVIENWRRHYNHRRPHRSLGGQPPAPLTFFAPPMGGAMGSLSPPTELLCIRMAEEAPQSACH